jgi:hypothetical protein
MQAVYLPKVMSFSESSGTITTSRCSFFYPILIAPSGFFVGADQPFGASSGAVSSFHRRSSACSCTSLALSYGARRHFSHSPARAISA